MTVPYNSAAVTDVAFHSTNWKGCKSKLLVAHLKGSPQSRHNFGKQVLCIFFPSLIFGLHKVRERRKFVPATVKNKERSRGGGVKIMPVQGHYCFGNSVCP